MTGQSDSRKYHIITFGCQMNERDSETLAGYLEERGYTPTDTHEAADLVLINTCSVRDNADKGDKAALEAAAKAAAEGSDATANMPAVHGRAAYYGEKSIGLVDGGSVVGRLIFETLAQNV